MTQRRRMQYFELTTNLSANNFDMPFTFSARNKREAWKWAKKSKLKGERLIELKRLG